MAAATMYGHVIPPDSPCGCESGRLFGECHLKNDGIVLTSQPIRPPGATTGSAHKKCRLNFTHNCGEGISGDHIISAAVLKEITEQKVTVQGPGFSRTVGIRSDSLKTKWLCKRHNSALGPLDTQAGRLVRAVRRCEKALAEAQPAPLRTFLFSGFDIERWLLKTLLATYFGRMSSVVPGRFNLPPYVYSLFDQQSVRPFGLYVPTVGEGQQVRATVVAQAVTMRLVTQANIVCGIEVSLAGLELRYIIAGSLDAVDAESKTGSFRPKAITLFQGPDVYALLLGWMEPGEHIVTLSRGDPDGELPSNK